MKYINKFENHAAYEAAESNLALPNVALCASEHEVHYKPNPCNVHDYVEIGGIKWATKNVGACTETDYGNYYQYGGGAKTYQETSGETPYDGTGTLPLEYDTANKVWGDNWRMPTDVEFSSLISATTYSWETNFKGSGVNGGKFTDKKDSSKYVFFPATGIYNNGYAPSVGGLSYIWSSIANDTASARAMNIDSSSHEVSNYSSRSYYGMPVRPVFNS